MLLALLLSNGSVLLREYASMGANVLPAGFEEAGTAALFAIALFVLLHLLELPFAYYQGFVLEHRYELSNQSFTHWASDQLKGGALGLLFAVLGVSVVYVALRFSVEWWWLVSAIAFALAMIVLAQLAPVLLLPLFFAGMGATRRILLSDTLLSDYSNDEIEVVLAHELSHHVHHDLWRAVAVQSALLIVAFYVAHVVLRYFAAPLALRGIDDPAGLPLLLLTGGVCSLVFLPAANAFSRSHERRADRYALEMTRQPASFISAMKRLSQQNMAEEDPSRLVQWLFYSHPPIRDRIAFARRFQSSPS